MSVLINKERQYTKYKFYLVERIHVHSIQDAMADINLLYDCQMSICDNII